MTLGHGQYHESKPRIGLLPERYKKRLVRKQVKPFSTLPAFILSYSRDFSANAKTVNPTFLGVSILRGGSTMSEYQLGTKQFMAEYRL